MAGDTAAETMVGVNGWENPLLLFADAGRSAVLRVGGFFVACWLGCGVALASAGFPLPLGCSPLAVPVYWVGGIGFGVLQGWGLLAYLVLLGLAATLVAEERPPWPTLAAAFLVQAGETARMLATTGPVRWWLLAILVAAVASGGAGYGLLERRSEQLRARRRFRRNMGYCVECGYDLCASIRAGSGACPECGATIPGHTVNVVRAPDFTRESQAA